MQTVLWKENLDKKMKQLTLVVNVYCLPKGSGILQRQPRARTEKVNANDCDLSQDGLRH